MTDIYTPAMRVLVAAALLLATATLMLVAVNTVRAAGALAIGSCGAFGEAFDFRTTEEARQSALSKCAGDTCRVVTTAKRGCAAFAVDFANPCGAHGWGQRAAARPQPERGATGLLPRWRQGVRDPHLLLRRQGLISPPRIPDVGPACNRAAGKTI
jgi:hypothetical protein